MASSGEPASVRDRLGEPTALAISVTESAGAVTAARHTGDGWTPGFVELGIASGDVTASVDRDGTITLADLDLAIDPIEIPESVLGYPVQLTDIHVTLGAPAVLPTTWDGNNDSHATGELPLVLSWSLTNHGTTSPLGSPPLPSVPADVQLTGTGDLIHAEVRAHVPGVLWTWADLIQLQDLSLVLAAASN